MFSCLRVVKVPQCLFSRKRPVLWFKKRRFCNGGGYNSAGTYTAFIKRLHADSAFASFLSFVTKNFVFNEKKASLVTSVCSKLVSKHVELLELRSLVSDSELEELWKMAYEDIAKQNVLILNYLQDLIEIVNPAVGSNIHSATLEVTAGVGGQEAMLWVKDLFEMYENVMPALGFRFEALEYDKTDIGGLRKASASLSGPQAYKILKFEGGIHRVQRVPLTERMGRIHTSTAAVVVMPQPTEIEVELNQNDLSISTFRSSGPGGQHVNRTDSAVRIIHQPTGIIVTCQEARSQHKNKELALAKLRTILYEKKLDAQLSAERSKRRLQVGTRSRSEKIRTYNWPRRRITDHRISSKLPETHNLDDALMGGRTLVNIFQALQAIDQEDRMQAVIQGYISSCDH